jgi:hypothetical protein
LNFQPTDLRYYQLPPIKKENKKENCFLKFTNSGLS